MVYNFITLIASTALLLTACSNSVEETVIDKDIETRNVQTPVIDSPAFEKITPPVNQVQMDASASTQKVAGSPALNPAHGQPGHRCDLAVGAPLPATVNTTTDAVPSVMSEPIKPVDSKPVLNPAHGQPGHRCDLAVGAPINTPAP
jgi:hypothetical protein